MFSRFTINLLNKYSCRSTFLKNALRQLERSYFPFLRVLSLAFLFNELVLLSSSFVPVVKQISSNRVAKNNDCSVTFNNTNSITELLMEFTTQDERRAPSRQTSNQNDLINNTN